MKNAVSLMWLLLIAAIGYGLYQLWQSVQAAGGLSSYLGVGNLGTLGQYGTGNGILGSVNNYASDVSLGMGTSSLPPAVQARVTSPAAQAAMANGTLPTADNNWGYGNAPGDGGGED